MNYKNLAKKGLFLSFVAMVFSACEKVNDVTPIGDGGQTIVKIVGGGNIDANFAPAGSLSGQRVDTLFAGSGLALNAIDFVNRPTNLPNTVTIRRDVANNADLNKTMTVTVKDDTTAINKHNALNGTNLVKLPESFYTVQSSSAKVGGQGGAYTFVFKPGEFSKEINVVVTNPTLLNPSASYALAFTITGVDAGGVLSYSHTILMQIGAKNDYDGRYRMKGIHNRPTYQFPYDQEMHMITTGASSVIFYWPEAASIGHPIGTGPDIVNDVSWYGPAIAPHVVFNPATNLVSEVYNNAGGTIISIYTGPGSGVGRFEPGSKTMYVYWRYNNNNARGFMDTLYYLGPR